MQEKGERRGERVVRQRGGGDSMHPCILKQDETPPVGQHIMNANDGNTVGGKIKYLPVTISKALNLKYCCRLKLYNSVSLDSFP